MANELFMDFAKSADYAFYDLKLLLTRPPVEKLLPDRPPIPPGAAYPKTLVVNMRGTLVHSEYKVNYKVIKEFKFSSDQDLKFWRDQDLVYFYKEWVGSMK